MVPRSTIVTTVVTTAVARAIERSHHRRNLGGAFVGEISALLSIGEHRGYEVDARRELEEARKAGRPAIFYFDADREYQRVYAANAGALGILPKPIPEKIALFYTLLNAVLEDVARLRREQVVTPEYSYRRLEQTIAVFGLMRKAGEDAAAGIRERGWG